MGDISLLYCTRTADVTDDLPELSLHALKSPPMARVHEFRRHY